MECHEQRSFCYLDLPGHPLLSQATSLSGIWSEVPKNLKRSEFSWYCDAHNRNVKKCAAEQPWKGHKLRFSRVLSGGLHQLPTLGMSRMSLPQPQCENQFVHEFGIWMWFNHGPWIWMKFACKSQENDLSRYICKGNSGREPCWVGARLVYNSKKVESTGSRYKYVDKYTYIWQVYTYKSYNAFTTVCAMLSSVSMCVYIYITV